MIDVTLHNLDTGQTTRISFPLSREETLRRLERAIAQPSYETDDLCPSGCYAVADRHGVRMYLWGVDTESTLAEVNRLTVAVGVAP